MSILASIVNYVFPPRCISCSGFIGSVDGFCGSCYNKYTFITNPCCSLCGKQLNVVVDEGQICGQCYHARPLFDYSRSLMKFDEHSKGIIHALKYYDKTIIAKVVSKLLYARYHSDVAGIDFIIPVPMHRFKRLVRMYNQAHVLAHAFSKLVDKPVYPNVLIKHKWTKPQTSLSKKQREKNLVGSIKIAKKYNVPGSLRGKNILIIDDVLTTGSTINACSRLLKSAGAAKVYVLTIART